MATPRKIKANSGSMPEGKVASPPANPTPPREMPGRLIREGGRLYVISGSTRIPVEDTGSLTPPPESNHPAPPLRAKNGRAVPANLLKAVEAVRKSRDRFLKTPGVIEVRAGYRFENGAITKEPAVVIAISGISPGKGLDKEQKRSELALPKEIDGIPIDLEIADPYQRLARDQKLRETIGQEAAEEVRNRPPLLIDELQEEPSAIEALEAVPVITYEPPRGANLEPVTGAMTVTCHVSPDSGWNVLETFLNGVERKLHMGMYDFTAPHIYNTARELLKNPDVEWQQVLGPKESLPKEDDPDSTKANDKTEEAVIRGLRRAGGERFANAFARVGKGETFASAYHIKVAVRDDKTFWLSSGNWQSSNQPDLDFFNGSIDRNLIRQYNREWHVVCDNSTLAKRFQRYLDHDYDVASTTEEAAALPAPAGPELLVPVEDVLLEERRPFGLQVFAPQKFTFDELTVQPILTPDNYLKVVLPFLKKKPREKLYFQNQSLNPILEPTDDYAELLELLADRSNDPDLDVRIIFRKIGSVRKKLESLQAAGFNMSRIRIQSGCHTKGIIVDSETILLGSHNITNQGVEANRDASLLIRNRDIAGYYEKIFLHDWEMLAKPTIREESVPMIMGSEESANVDIDVMRLPFSYYEEE